MSPLPTLTHRGRAGVSSAGECTGAARLYCTLPGSESGGTRHAHRVLAAAPARDTHGVCPRCTAGVSVKGSEKYAVLQDPGRGVSLGKGIAGTLQIKGRASSMLLKGEETLPADVQEEEEKAEKTHRAKARAMYINRWQHICMRAHTHTHTHTTETDIHTRLSSSATLSPRLSGRCRASWHM